MCKNQPNPYDTETLQSSLLTPNHLPRPKLAQPLIERAFFFNFLQCGRVHEQILGALKYVL